MLSIERLKPNKKQPRKIFEETALQELSDSIKIQGVLQPIIVRRLGENYEIVAGERRWRAAGLAGLQEVPAIVKDFSDSQALQVALIENILREDLDPLEEAESYNRLIRDYGFTHEKLAEAMGKSRVAVTNSMRLLKLPPEILSLLAEGRLTAGRARALMMLENAASMLRLAEDIVGRQMSVRDAETRARLMAIKHKPKAAGKKGRSNAEASIEERLQRALRTKVSLEQRNGKGTITVFFNSLAELDGILDKMVA